MPGPRCARRSATRTATPSRTNCCDVVLAIVRDRPVGPVARISTSRTVDMLYGADGAALAEFCDDDVVARAEDDEDPSSGGGNGNSSWPRAPIAACWTG